MENDRNIFTAHGLIAFGSYCSHIVQPALYFPYTLKQLLVIFFNTKWKKVSTVLWGYMCKNLPGENWLIAAIPLLVMPYFADMSFKVLYGEEAFNFSIITVNWGLFSDTRNRNMSRNASSFLGEYSAPMQVCNLSPLPLSSAGDWYLSFIAVRRSVRDAWSIFTSHLSGFRLERSRTSNSVRF